jgi:hypothetical protein
MANFIYKKAKESFLKGEINLYSNTIKVLILNNTYTPNVNTHQFVSDINSSSIEDRSSGLSNKTVTDGVFDADDVTIGNYSGNSFNAVALYSDSGSDATSRLIAYLDTSTGLPFSSANIQAPVTIVWNNDSTKIIAL